MYTEPNSTIILCSGVPLDMRYTDTLYFSSDTAQYNYFYSKRKMVFERETYNRVQKGITRLRVNAERIYDCNYMMFRNTSYGNKWFYAFINNCEYINDNVTEVRFTIDPVQTWLGEIRGKLGECYVIRNHSVSDRIGENTRPEGVDTGEMVFNNYQRMPILDDGHGYDWTIGRVFISVMDTKSSGVSGNMYDGVFGGATLKVYSTTQRQAIIDELNKYTAAPGNVVAMYMAPTALMPQIPEDHIVPNNESGPKYTGALTGISTNDTLNGYKPRNNKLYTYPYNYCHIDNANGQTMALRYELFPNLTPKIVYYGTITAPVQVCIKPVDYKGTSGPEHTECLTLSNFPMCSWATDSFSAWLAQNTIDLPEKGTAGGTIARIARTILTGGPVADVRPANIEGKTLAPNALMSILSNPAGAIQSLLGQAYQSSIAQEIASGNFSSGGANTAAGYQSFFSGRVSCRAEYAKLIDDYFDAYGYAQNQLMVPRIDARPIWCYVKTAGAVLLGDLPADDRAAVVTILDNGIRFWKDPAKVGDFTGDNSPA